MPPQTHTVTVPPVPPEGDRASWRRRATGWNPAHKGGYALQGEPLDAGARVELPAGALLVAVDKYTTAWDTHYRTGKPYPVQEATVTLHLVGADGLEPVWSRHYKRATNAMGATTATQIRRLLAEHPPPETEPVVIEQVQRPNHTAGPCRWCGSQVAPGRGHRVGRGPTALVEHWRQCPEAAGSSCLGAPCARCGTPVDTTNPGRRCLVRASEHTGHWELVHRHACPAEPRPADAPVLAQLVEPLQPEHVRMLATTDRRCQRCGEKMRSGTGVLVGWHEQARWLHLGLCPTRAATSGTPCALCGVEVAALQAYQAAVAVEGGGLEPGTVWQTRHRPEMCCTQVAVPSLAEQQAAAEQAAAQRRAEAEQARAEAQKAEAKRRRARERAAERRRARREAAEAAHAAEQERVQHLAEVRTEQQLVTSKGLGPGRGRAALYQLTVHLEDETTTTRWRLVVTPEAGGWTGEDFDDAGAIAGTYPREDEAREAYRSWKYEKPDPWAHRRRGGGPAFRIGDVACPPGGAQHCYHCGAHHSQGGWMIASLGPACGPDCYDAMADRRGAHDRRYH